MFLIRFSCHGIVKFLIKPLRASCIPCTRLHLIVEIEFGAKDEQKVNLDLGKVSNLAVLFKPLK